MIKPPREPNGRSRAIAWLRSLLRFVILNQTVSIEGYMTQETPSGKIFKAVNKKAMAENWPPVLYDPSKSYSAGDWIWVKPSSTAVTVGIRDITTGIITQATAGLYRAQTSIAPGKVAVSGTPVTAYYIPQLPEPNTDDITATNVKWIYFRGVASC